MRAAVVRDFVGRRVAGEIKKKKGSEIEGRKDRHERRDDAC